MITRDRISVSQLTLAIYVPYRNHNLTLLSSFMNYNRILIRLHWINKSYLSFRITYEFIRLMREVVKLFSLSCSFTTLLSYYQLFLYFNVRLIIYICIILENGLSYASQATDVQVYIYKRLKRFVKQHQVHKTK